MQQPKPPPRGIVPAPPFELPPRSRYEANATIFQKRKLEQFASERVELPDAFYKALDTLGRDQAQYAISFCERRALEEAEAELLEAQAFEAKRQRVEADRVLLGCLIFVLLPIAAVVGFGYYQAFLEQQKEQPAVDRAREEAATKRRIEEMPSGTWKLSPSDPASVTPAPTPSAEEIAAVRREGEARAFAAAVSASQERALVKYPALGQLGSEINSRFTFRYKRMKAANDPLLNQPDWPERLADACAAAKY